jgi:transmembrane sensor
MSAPQPTDSGGASAHDEAMLWMSRIDRGLTPAEQDEFFAWLATSPAHGESLNRCRQRWRRLDRLADWRPECSFAPNPDLLAPHRRSLWWRRGVPALLAAACIAFVATVWQGQQGNNEPPKSAIPFTPKPEDRRILPDQSVVKLNDGTVHTVLFSETERRVRLDRGEAFFKVTKDANRPFVVEVGGATVRALGTAFNVRLAGGELDVLVAEGRVEVAPPPQEARPDRGVALALDPTVLSASQRVSLSLHTPNGSGQVATLTRREIQQTLAWQHGLMTFQDQPLAAIVEELNRLNARQITLMDEPIAALRFSGTIRSDNLDGFVRLLETSFGADVTHRDGSEIQVRTRGISR